MDYEGVLQVISNLGAVAVLVWGAILFLNGSIINKASQDQILTLYEKRMDDLTARIVEKMDEIITRVNGR